MLHEPDDFIGNILGKLLNRQLENQPMRGKVGRWRMSVVLDTDYYPISIIFSYHIEIVADYVDDPTIVLSMKFNTIIRLFRGETSMIRAVLGGAIKTRGLLKHPLSMIRFYRLMTSILGG
ncbi:MAG: hypothetical protein C4K48_04210 [Candidatus Thorarchaeota archaeon]|nr:MAG: hypothetical protein C4K48_04210 [Candidatus Thorarchaeota archaeon]